MPIFYLIEFRLAKGKKKGTTGVPSRFWGQKFLKTGAPLRRIWKELGLDRKIRQLKQDVDIEPAVFFLVALTIMGVSFEERDFFLGDPATGLTERHLAAARTFLEENRDGLQCWLTKKLHDRF